MRSNFLPDRAQRLRQAAPGLFACLVLVTGSLLWVGNASADSEEVASKAANLRRSGHFRLAIDLLEGERARSGESCSAKVLGELGAAYLQAHRLTEAESRLMEAYEKSVDTTERAIIANDLGNLYASGERKEKAAAYYRIARDTGNLETSVSAGLNLARSTPSDTRLSELSKLQEQIARVQDPRERARFSNNLGSQARLLGPQGRRLAHENLERARSWAAQAKDRFVLAEALDELSQLYEDNNRVVDALGLTTQAIAQLQSDEAPEMLISLQWRRGRLLRAQGLDELALGAYQAAVDHVEAVRQDIPIEYVDGRSSFRETLEPIYVGLAELLLRRAGNATGDERLQLFRRARDAVELIKQTELQDYLGERCLVTSLAPGTASQLTARTAVLYPVILANRLALLVETQAGIEAAYASIDSDVLRAKATLFARGIKEALPGYLAAAQELYDLLLRPIEPMLAEQKIDTLVFVPDGPLRMVPIGALHDGKRFLIEKFAVAIAPGLTVIGSAKQEQGIGKVLLAGLSEPGPVVGKLGQRAREQLGLGPVTRGTRAPDQTEELALPGVTEEIQALKAVTHGDRLLNSEFTVERFRQQFGAEEYRTVHIASHAVFSQRSEGSFILAYDDLLTMDQLQTLLRGRTLEENPISLLSLSACQTAEGDDRVPLGIAGAALKAHAGSALGSLWPVDDVATKTLMVGFYESMTKVGMTKAKALQQAQLALLNNKSMDHPFFWAPFILVGSGQ